MATSITTFGASGVFPGQSINTLSAVDLTDANVNGGNINLSDDGSEVIFNLVNHFYEVIRSQSPATSKITATTSSSIAGGELVKNYNFTVRLGLTGDNIASLNVADESND